MTQSNFNRRALTLIELVVVLAILVALAGLAVPMFGGLASQTNGSTNAVVVGEVNSAIGTYFSRFDGHADGWDSLLNSSDTLFSKLHPALTTSATLSGSILSSTPQSLTNLQAESLNTLVGIDYLTDADETSGLSPNTPGTQQRPVEVGRKVVMLNRNSALAAEAFGISSQNSDLWPHDFVVVGLGGATGIRGQTMMEVPLVLSADPSERYARVLCVFLVPGSSATTTFPARYLGCFLPDGTSLRQNIDRYHTNRIGN